MVDQEEGRCIFRDVGRCELCAAEKALDIPSDRQLAREGSLREGWTSREPERHAAEASTHQKRRRPTPPCGIGALRVQLRRRVETAWLVFIPSFLYVTSTVHQHLPVCGPWHQAPK